MKHLAVVFFFAYYWQLVFASSVSNEITVNEERKKCLPAHEQIISQCLQPILTYASTIQESSSGQNHFSLQGGKIFKSLCSLYSDFKDCTSSVSCHSISLEAVEASYGYMCGAGYSLFERHASCFAEVEAQADYVVCKEAASQAMDDALRVKQDDLDMYLHQVCGVMDNYLRCCRPFVYEKCGPDAWKLVRQITTDSLRVTMPTCDVNRALL